MPAPLPIALLTDFGGIDAYVGVMKGVITAINPAASIIDLTHYIPPQDIWAARYQLTTAVPYLPRPTVYVSVVDPGVGSQRRAIAVQTAVGYFVAPDNGVLTGVLDQDPAIAAVTLTNPAYWRSPIPSASFHGRDIFAPVGAHLASGVPLSTIGPAIAPDSLVRLELPPLRSLSGKIPGVQGVVQAVDHFGNVITTLPHSLVRGSTWQVQWQTLHIPGRETYSQVAGGALVAIGGSHGWVEIAMNGGHAQSHLNAAVGDPVILWQVGESA